MELLGITVSIHEKSQKKIRVFPLLPVDQIQPRLRTNETYDELMKIDPKKRVTTKTELRDQMRGQIDVCILRDLTYFDVGKSFLSDSLHNIYHGVMVGCEIILIVARLDENLRENCIKDISRS